MKQHFTKTGIELTVIEGFKDKKPTIWDQIFWRTWDSPVSKGYHIKFFGVFEMREEKIKQYRGMANELQSR